MPRQIACVDLSDFTARKAEISKQLTSAATGVGFLQVTNHGIPQQDIDAAFARSKAFFALEDAVKANSPFRKGSNRGWEKNAQVRPSSGVADLKESLQCQWHGMDGIWPQEAVLPGFQAASLAFMGQCEALAQRIMAGLAVGLGLPEDFFAKLHDPSKHDAASTLRLLHYQDVTGQTFEPHYFRAAPHTDFDSVTLLFQRPGQGGLEVCPGAEAKTAYGLGDEWTPVEPVEGAITINFGRMLTRWSDDRIRATLHRVVAPKPGQYQGPRYSIAYFAQANADAVIQGPEKRYPPISGGDFILQAMTSNFDTKYKVGANDSPFLAEEAYRKQQQPVQVA